LVGSFDAYKPVPDMTYITWDLIPDITDLWWDVKPYSTSYCRSCQLIDLFWQ